MVLLGCNWRLYLACVGFAVVVAVQANLDMLQSSIEVKGDLGTTGLVVYQLLCSVSVLLYVPLAVLMGRKKCLIVGQIASVLLTLSMLYPRFWTLLPAQLFAGIVESVVLPAFGVIITSLSQCNMAANNAAERKESNIRTYIVILGIGQSIISLAPNLILKERKEEFMSNATAAAGNVTSFSSCGAYDCPMDYAFEEHSTKFQRLIPTPESLSTYLLIFVGIQLTGMAIQWFVIPNDTKIQETQDEEKTGLVQSSNRNTEAMKAYKRAFIRLITLVSSKLCLLAIPIQIQYGLFGAFNWTEVSRSYFSCSIGVQHIGILQSLLFLASAMANLLLFVLRTIISKPVLYICSFFCEMFVYLLSLLWQPSDSAMYVLYIYASSVGITLGLRRFTAFSIASAYFEDVDSAFVVQTWACAFGAMCVFVMSGLFCVYVKIYILGACSFVSTIFIVYGHYCAFNTL